ncbi:DUF721 domain-containing protein [Candidatus Saccharibacteria bacterium]|nr:DUF721 domain-containing protein [Candidatus Saccharibacteria bacterium]
MTFEPLKDTLDTSLRRSPIRGVALALKVEAICKRILPKWAEMVSFKDGRLVLASPSPTHSQELFLKARELKKVINEQLPARAVEEIKFRIL